MSRLLRALTTPPRALAAGLVACAAVLLLFAPQHSLAQPTTVEGGKLETFSAMRGAILDTGRLIVSQNGKPVRVEEFAFERTGDTLLVRAASMTAAPGQTERAPDKSMILIVGPLDYAMGSYWSQFVVGPDTLRRGVEVTLGDTVLTLWREVNNAGTGDVIAMPPGRMYVLDPPIFTTFSLIGRALHGKACNQRPIKVLVLGARDSLVDATVTEVGTETIRWGARAVTARKLIIADEQTSFAAWISPDGRLLRLEQAQAGIRVERQAPPVKRRPPRPK